MMWDLLAEPGLWPAKDHDLQVLQEVTAELDNRLCSGDIMVKGRSFFSEMSVQTKSTIKDFLHEPMHTMVRAKEHLTHPITHHVINNNKHITTPVNIYIIPKQQSLLGDTSMCVCPIDCPAQASISHVSLMSIPLHPSQASDTSPP